MALKKMMGVATSIYIIDTPLEANSEGSNGQDAHLQGSYLQRSGIYLHSWAVFGAGGVCPSPSDLILRPGSAGHFGWRGGCPLPCRASERFLVFLLAVLPFPLLPEQPDVGCRVSICRDTGWTKAGSSPEELKRYKGEQDDFSF